MYPTDDQTAAKAKLDRCVKCGMCLPECPTYRLSSDENESPRGRLALIEGLADGRLKPDTAVRRHLDNCLTCRRCEAVCPSGVEYGSLVEYARAELAPGKPRRWLKLLQEPRLMRWAGQAAQLLPSTLSKPLGPLHRLHLLGNSLVGGGRPPRPGHLDATSRPIKGRVGLLLGCATSAKQGTALSAAVLLLRYCGFDVEIPADQGCCGALAQHAGDVTTAKRQAEALQRAFPRGLDAVISIASGCGVHIEGHASPIQLPHRDICEFLLTESELTADDFRPLDVAVLAHTPCTMANVYKGGNWSQALLSKIPGVSVEPLGVAGQCCGSAGDYMLRHPAIADILRRPLLDQALAHPTAPITTTNIGCAMHISAGLLERGTQREVLHPVELLARQLADRSM